MHSKTWFLFMPKLIIKDEMSYGVLWLDKLLTWLLIIKFFPFVALKMFIMFVIQTTRVA